MLEALLRACADPSYGASVVAVGSDRDEIRALTLAAQAQVPAFVHSVGDYPTREAWDKALADKINEYKPDIVISAGFLKLVGEAFLAEFGDRFVNTHPSLLPAFPGMHAPRDAIEHGVKVAGCTMFFVDAGVDSGPIIDQRAVPVLDDDTPPVLHERIKEAERAMLVEVIGRMANEGWTISGRKVSIP